MPLKGQACIGLGHSPPVVDDLYGCPPGIDDDDMDMPCAGIDGVLDQFLDDRSGTLYDLAGSYQVRNRIGEQVGDVRGN